MLQSKWTVMPPRKKSTDSFHQYPSSLRLMLQWLALHAAFFSAGGTGCHLELNPQAPSGTRRFTPWSCWNIEKWLLMKNITFFWYIVPQIDLTHLKRCPWIFACGFPNTGLNKSDTERWHGLSWFDHGTALQCISLCLAMTLHQNNGKETGLFSTAVFVLPGAICNALWASFETWRVYLLPHGGTQGIENFASAAGAHRLHPWHASSIEEGHRRHKFR